MDYLELVTKEKGLTIVGPVGSGKLLYISDFLRKKGLESYTLCISLFAEPSKEQMESAIKNFKGEHIIFDGLEHASRNNLFYYIRDILQSKKYFVFCTMRDYDESNKWLELITCRTITIDVERLKEFPNALTSIRKEIGLPFKTPRIR
jgi:hypothetical protein